MKSPRELSLLAATIGLALGMSCGAHAADQRYIVKFKEGHVAAGKAAIKGHGGRAALNLERVHAQAAYLPQKAVQALRNNPHVEYVEEDVPRYPLSFSDTAGDPMQVEVTPYGIPMVQADQLSYSVNSGVKVCIIDSGLDMSNPDFNWNNITGSNDPGTGNWWENGGPHGTHVAGTIAALGGNGQGVVGVNSNGDIPLHIVKVFNADGWGYSSTLIAAANTCADNGAKIISMSLGGSFKSRTEQRAFSDLASQGVLSIAAAGNDGNSRLSYPASYDAVVSVAAVDHNAVRASFSQYNSQVELSAPGVDTLSTYPAGMATMANADVGGTPYKVSAMENLGSGTGMLYDFALGESVDAGANGKVCLIQRGNISFHDKVLNCENSGGVAAIIYNNEPGMLYGTLGTSNSTTIPAVGAAQEDGQALLAAVGQSTTVSVGPSDYGYMSGTSMATPHVSGVAALVWSHHPSCSGADIRNALDATALDLEAPGRDNNTGFGLIQALAAHQYLDVNGCSGSSGGGGSGGSGGSCKGGPKKCGG